MKCKTGGCNAQATIMERCSDCYEELTEGMNRNGEVMEIDDNEEQEELV